MILPAFIFPIGPLLSILGKWFQSNREKLNRDSRNKDLKSELTTFGFMDRDHLPLPENDALELSAKKLAENDFESAKHLLINAWLLTPTGIGSEPAFLRLKEGFIKLYIAKGDKERAERIAKMPTMILDNEVQWIVTHPDAQIAGSSVDE